MSNPHLGEQESCEWQNEFTGRRKALADWFVTQMAHHIEREYAGTEMKEIYDSGILDVRQAGKHKAVGLGTNREEWLVAHWSTESIVLDVILSILDDEEVRNNAIQNTGANKSSRINGTNKG